MRPTAPWLLPGLFAPALALALCQCSSSGGKPGVTGGANQEAGAEAASNKPDAGSAPLSDGNVADFVVADSATADSPGEANPPRPEDDIVRVDGRVFRDGRGRQRLFRGYNTKVNGIFDVSFDDGRTPNYTFVGLDEMGAQRLEELGFNVLRLPLSWSALEPHPQHYADAVLQKIADVVDMAWRHHLYVVLDMHQDAYSKEIGEDGAPLWAIVPPPLMLLQGPSDDSRRTQLPALTAGFSFFSNVNATDGRPLQDAFVAAAQQVLKRVAGRPGVLGFEAFNEPIVVTENQLSDFHVRFADGIHAIDANLPILFEPIGLRNQVDMATVSSTPWMHGPGAYAPHIYTGQFSVPSQNGWESEDPTKLEPSMTAANHEAEAWGTPLFVTEFGCDQSLPRGSKWLAAELDLQDRYLVSSTAWAWDSGNWGFTGPDGKEWPATTKVVSRSFPRAVAGDITLIERPMPGHLVVHYRPTPQTHRMEHEVSTSASYATNYRVLCDSTEVSFKAATGRATFVCPDIGDGLHYFEVIGTPVP